MPRPSHETRRRRLFIRSSPSRDVPHLGLPTRSRWSHHVRRSRVWALAVGLSLWTIPGGAQAQDTLRLRTALDRAASYSFGNRVARASTATQQAAGMAALRGLLPSLRVESGWMQTTDPIGAFGTALRQRAITTQAFDPARLNYPGATPNYGASLILEQPLFNADAWAGRQAAGSANEAQQQAEVWTRGQTSLDIIAGWTGAMLAFEKVAMLRAALTAAHEHVRQAESLARNGMVTPSDALLASVRAGEVEAQLIEAEGQAAVARLGLATAMGTPSDTSFLLPASLPDDAAVRSALNTASTLPLAPRADVRAAREATRAANADLARARTLYLPRVNSFARQDWNSSLRPFGGTRNWTTGIMVSWSPFAGAAELAETRSATARHSKAIAEHEGALARAALQQAQTSRALEVAGRRLALAGTAVRQSIDAHRIVARKYDAGLATVVELLDAAAMERQARLSHALARHDGVLAAASRYRAMGHDPAELAMIDAPAAVTAPDR